MDGRHRATAISTSGKAQYVLVIRGLARETMRVLDTGYKRTFANYLSTQKVPYVQAVGNVTGRLLDWRRGNYATSAATRRPGARYLGAKKSHQKLIHTFENDRDEIITAVKHGKSIATNFPGGPPATVFAFAYLLLRRLDPYKCAEFFGELTGDHAQKSTDADYPVRALEKTLTSRAGEDGLRDWLYLSWIFRTWNCWLSWENGEAGERLSRDQFRKIKRPRWDLLAMPEDPNEATREPGWEPL
jgi:hypothetical protein